MLTIRILLSLNLLFAFASVAQERPYLFKRAIEEKIASSNNGLGWQIGATDYAFQGNFKEALNTWNKQRINAPAPSLHPFDSTFLAESKAISARDYILKRSKTEEIVILNELHHNPSHRVFAASLLKELYANGYRYLGLEALADAHINQRKFATTESGYYTSEPEFGNFIKEALDLGFSLFGYEATEAANWDPDNWKNREIGQAQNIYKFMQNNKGGKYFIYVGAGHAFEGNNNGRGLSMAGVLAQLTGINPFTIDQNRYAYRGEDRYSSPLTRLVDGKEPMVLQKSNGEIFRSSANSYETDVSIIQPALMFKEHLPYWNQQRKPLNLDFKNISEFPIMVQVFRAGEEKEKGVPIAIREFSTAFDVQPIYIPDVPITWVVYNENWEVVAQSK